ncbi:MAG: hypothetical protein KatS3mg105_3924 [Gemmatales bacterium]|nr:MAG: hypothetical protein KatS3mg105_3924 [Gemmatales bacterium]
MTADRTRSGAARRVRARSFASGSKTTILPPWLLCLAGQILLLYIAAAIYVHDVVSIDQFEPTPQPARMIQQAGHRLVSSTPAFELMFFDHRRPVRLGFHVTIDGIPVRDIWNAYFDRLLACLDLDGNRALDRKEISRVPASLLSRPVWAFVFTDSSQFCDFDAIDRAPRDGRVSREELLLHSLKGGTFPVQVLAGRSPEWSEQLSAALFELLDQDQDGNLSQADCVRLTAGLARCNHNQDGLLSPEEVAGQTGPLYPLGNREFAQTSRFAFLPSGSINEQMIEQLMHRYDKNRNDRLSRGEVGLPAELFDSLDADRNGEWSAGELRQWQQPDYVVEVELRTDPWKKLTTRMRPSKKTETREFAVSTGLAGIPTLRTPTCLVDLKAMHGRLQAVFEASNRLAVATFLETDADSDGVLDRRDIRSSKNFAALAPILDKNWDGKVSIAEFDSFVALQREAVRGHVVLTILDLQRGLFQLLDRDRDSLLSTQELSGAWTVLAAWDENGDGVVSKNELPQQYHVTVSQGQPWRP